MRDAGFGSDVCMGFLWVSDFLSGALHRDGSPKMEEKRRKNGGKRNCVDPVDPISTSD